LLYKTISYFVLLLLFYVAEVFSQVCYGSTASLTDTFSIIIRIKINGNVFDLKFGCLDSASNSFDNGIDVLAAPPGFNPYVYLSIDSFPYYLREDYRNPGSEHQWKIVITNAAAESSFFEWDASVLPENHELIFNKSIDMVNDSTAGLFGNQNLIIDYTPHELTAKRVEKCPISTSFLLNQNYPNPFNASTTICFYLPRNLKICLKIINLFGEEVKVLMNGVISTGFHNVIWDGTDNFGRPVSTGLYVYELVSEEFRCSKKLLYLK